MILISPYAKELRNGKQNPKNYPYWPELLKQIDEPVIQVGISGETQLIADFRQNLSLFELRKLISECRTWISCDSMFQHLAWDCGKPGIVLWSVSDPNIFGHKENTNLLLDRSMLSENQFLWWETVEHDASKFVKPELILKHLEH